MDWVDPEDAPGVGTPVRGGATYREAHLAMEIIADRGGMLSSKSWKSTPCSTKKNRNRRPRRRITASAFGKKIL